jgi:choline monooxygenase
LPPPSETPADKRSDFFDDGLRERLNSPTVEGSALPNSAYTSDGFFGLEQRTLFRSTWVFAGFVHDLKNTGDVLPVDVAGSPVVLARGEDSVIRAFHNVCRHRGAKLVGEFRSGCKSFVCPNHSWSYSLDGRLLARPHFFGGDNHDINREPRHRADLVPVRCETWHDWIFVNLDGEAMELDQYVQPVSERLQGYDFTALEFAEALEFQIQANWKLAIENFIEPYHVFSCHPWLNSFVGMAERQAPTFDGHVLHCGYEFQKTDPARGEGLPYFPNLPEEARKRGEWFVLFPNFAFEIFPDQVDVFIATPVSTDRSIETIALYFIGAGAHEDQYARGRETVIQNWNDLNAEDIGIIERMQAGRASEGFDGGVLSPYWDPVLQHFARLVYDAVGGNGK